MSVPLLDLKAQYATIETEIRAALDRVLASQVFIMGPEVEACEREVAAYCGARHGIGVSSGTDALLVGLMALEVGPGDEVIVPTYSFFATAGAVARLGAKPVFIDIDPATFNIDPEACARAVTPRTKAIIPVHLFGQCADMDAILEIGRRHAIPVIEDAAQAIGAGHGGRRAGSLGTLGCFSFFPSKNLGAFGDGGMVTTNDDSLAERLRVLRVHGAKPKYHHHLVGGNFRLDALQAAVVRVKLGHLESWSAARQANARLYDELLDGIPGLVRPARTGHRHIFNQYVIRTPRRDALMAHLKDQGIGCEVYYPVPLHRQECFRPMDGVVAPLPEAERAAVESLALPIYPELSPDQIRQVAGAISDFLA